MTNGTSETVRKLATVILILVAVAIVALYVVFA